MSALDSMQSTRSVFTELSKSCEKVLMSDSLNLGKHPTENYLNYESYVISCIFDATMYCEFWDTCAVMATARFKSSVFFFGGFKLTFSQFWLNILCACSWAMRASNANSFDKERDLNRTFQIATCEIFSLWSKNISPFAVISCCYHCHTRVENCNQTFK